MKKIILYTFVLSILSISQMNAAAYTPYISGTGIEPYSYVKVGEECTYTVKYTSGSGTSTTNELIKWDINASDYELVKADKAKASITVKWKREGAHCKIKAYNIAIIDDNGKITSYDETSSTVKIKSSQIGNITLTTPEKVLVHKPFQIGVEIGNTIGDLYNPSISGDNFSASDWVSTGNNIGYFTGSFSSPGIKTITVRVSGNGLTSKTASKTITAYPNAINGEDAIAINGQKTYNLVNAPSDNYTWSVSNGLQIISGQGTSQVVVKHNGSYMGSGYIQVSFSGLTVKKDIAIGVPDINKVTASLGLGNTLYSYHTSRNECIASYSGTGTILEYKWESPDWEVFNPLTTNKSIVYLKAKNPGCCSTASIKLSVRNSAGWSSNILLGAQVNNSTSQYSIQLSTNTITVSENQEEINTTTLRSLAQNNAPLTYELYNSNTGNLAKKGSINKTGGNIDVSNLPNGVYIFSLIIDSSTKQTMKIAIK